MLKKTLDEDFYDMVDEKGENCGNINVYEELKAGKLTIYNSEVKLAACDLEYHFKMWLETERYDWIVDHETHIFAKDPQEMINAPIFQSDTLGAWLKDCIVMPKQVSAASILNDDNKDNNNDECDAATILKPGDIRVSVGSNNNTSMIIVEKIHDTIETAPQKRIKYRKMWKLRNVLATFATKLGLAANASLEEICNQSISDSHFSDESHVLIALKNDKNLNIDTAYVLSSKYFDTVCYKDKNNQFTVTEFSLLHNIMFLCAFSGQLIVHFHVAKNLILKHATLYLNVQSLETILQLKKLTSMSMCQISKNDMNSNVRKMNILFFCTHGWMNIKKHMIMHHQVIVK